MSNIQQFDFSIDLTQVLLWRYNDATNLQKLIELKQAWYEENYTQFWTNWHNDVFNLDTANDFGLSVWSIILDLPLQLGDEPDPPGKLIFGFGSETGTPNSYTNFNNGALSNGGNIINLSTEEKRILLKLRYYQFVNDGSVPAANRFLNYAFKELPGYTKVYIIDCYNMLIRMVFEFEPSDTFIHFLKTYDLVPRQSGVAIEYVYTTNLLFGFGSETAALNSYENFNNGALRGDEE